LFRRRASSPHGASLEGEQRYFPLIPCRPRTDTPLTLPFLAFPPSKLKDSTFFFFLQILGRGRPTDAPPPFPPLMTEPNGFLFFFSSSEIECRAIPSLHRDQLPARVPGSPLFFSNPPISPLTHSRRVKGTMGVFFFSWQKKRGPFPPPDPVMSSPP